jgi:hypothetical protein
MTIAVELVSLKHNLTMEIALSMLMIKPLLFICFFNIAYNISQSI